MKWAFSRIQHPKGTLHLYPVSFSPVVMRFVGMTALFDLMRDSTLFQRQCQMMFPEAFSSPPVPNVAQTNAAYQGWNGHANRLFFATGLRESARASHHNLFRANGLVSTRRSLARRNRLCRQHHRPQHREPAHI